MDALARSRELILFDNAGVGRSSGADQIRLAHFQSVRLDE